jgi:PKD repeat protein
MERDVMTKYITRAFVLMTVAVAAGCTVSDIDPPPLSGPSGMSTSLIITANPDVVSLDGSSQTLVTVEALDENGQPKPNVPLRVDILADGQVLDFGAISARTLTTGSNGRTSFTYTAPPFIGGTIPNLQLSITPTGKEVGFDAAAQLRRLVTIRLVPPGGTGIAPTARFVFVPTDPVAFTDVRFDGSASTAGLGAMITGYLWDFGDGTTATGMTATHKYGSTGSFFVRLTVTDSNGLSNTSEPQTITVGAGEPPTAAMIFSPTQPTTADTIFFNATQSTAGTGHRIVSYRWSWGDGASGSGATASHKYLAAGTYVVVLTVTDEVGQVGRVNVEVTVT